MLFRFILFISFTFTAFFGKAQAFSESDSLQSQVVFVLKGATTAQLNLIKTEFAKYPQITKATYVYTSLNYLLVDLNMSLNNPSFIRYSQLMKIMCGAISVNNILIKSSTSYNDIVNAADVSTLILK